MKIAVTDACIFIDLYDLRLNQAFFRLDLEIHTTVDVLNELFPEQQKALQFFQSSGRLTIHSIDPTERLKILHTPFPRSLSDPDKTVIYLATKINAIILSSDKVVRHYGKIQSIPYHGMLWIFDQLVDSGILIPSVAIEKILVLINSNRFYQQSVELRVQMDARVKKWAKLP